MAAVDCDVAIVGGGLAGSAAALAAAAAGVRCAIIEPRAVGAPARMPLRALALSEVSRRILERVGAWRAVRERACPVRKIHVSEQGVFGVTRICARREGLEALGYVVTAADLLRALHQTLAATLSVSVFSPARATAVERAPDRVCVVVDTGDGTRRLRARLLVLADGGASDFSRQLGFEARTKDYRQSAIVAAVEAEAAGGNGAGEHVAYERFTPNGPLAVLPIGGRRRVVAWVHPEAAAAAVAALSDADFIVRLQRVLGLRLGRLENPGQRFVYPLALRHSPGVARERSVLLGDAAHRVHPVAGQGFNLTLRDVAFLSQCAADAGGDVGARAVLAAYQACRVRDVRRVVRFTDLLATAFVKPGRGAAYLRGAGLVALDLLPPLRRAVVRRGLGLAPPWPRFAGAPLIRAEVRAGGDADGA